MDDVKIKYYKYLFTLQASGKTNMFGAGQYLENRFKMSREEAMEVLLYWMDNYEEIAKKLGRDI